MPLPILPIELLLLCGQPERFRRVRMNGRTASGFALTRSEVREAINWGPDKSGAPPRSHFAELHTQLGQPGSYILAGEVPRETSDEQGDDTFTTKYYVGHADSVISRLDNHLRERQWWTRAAILTDPTLTAAHFTHVEHALWRQARQDGLNLENIQTPKLQTLDLSGHASVHVFLDHAALFLPILGFPRPRLFPESLVIPWSTDTLFERPEDPKTNKTILTPPALSKNESERDEVHVPASASINFSSSELDSLDVPSHSNIFECTRSTKHGNVKARLRRETDGTFVLLEKSRGPEQTQGLDPAQVKRRKTALEEKQIAYEERELIVLKDIPFTSSSAAIRFIIGSSESGPRAWMLPGPHSMSLKEVFEKESRVSVPLENE